MREACCGVLPDDARARQPELVEVPLDRADGFEIRLDEHRPLGPTGKGLEPHRTRAGVQVEHAGAFDPGRDDVEDVLAHTIEVGRMPGFFGAWIEWPLRVPAMIRIT